MTEPEIVDEGEEEVTQALEVRRSTTMEASELTIEDLIGQVTLIQEAMRAVMRSDEHYGVIPGTGSKPTLLKPGAEKLCLLFRLDPEYEVVREHSGDDYIGITMRCTLFHIPTGNRVGSGIGSCNTREKKYRYRGVKRDKVPEPDEVDRLKAEDAGYFRKISGRWTWFDRIENDNPWEYENTVVKMAAKRALVAAVLNATAASDIFTQDVEDMPRGAVGDAGDASVGLAPLVKPATLASLMDALADPDLDPEIWGTEVVLANCTRRFGRPVTVFSELRQDEAEQLQAGVVAWKKGFEEAKAELDKEKVDMEEEAAKNPKPRGRKKKEAEPAESAVDDEPKKTEEELTTPDE